MPMFEDAGAIPNADDLYSPLPTDEPGSLTPTERPSVTEFEQAQHTIEAQRSVLRDVAVFLSGLRDEADRRL